MSLWDVWDIFGRSIDSLAVILGLHVTSEWLSQHCVDWSPVVWNTDCPELEVRGRFCHLDSVGHDFVNVSYRLLNWNWSWLVVVLDVLDLLENLCDLYGILRLCFWVLWNLSHMIKVVFFKEHLVLKRLAVVNLEQIFIRVWDLDVPHDFKVVEALWCLDYQGILSQWEQVLAGGHCTNEQQNCELLKRALHILN